MEIVTKIAPIALALIMLGLGLGLTSSDFTRILKDPKVFFVGIVSQILLLPVVAYTLITLINWIIRIRMQKSFNSIVVVIKFYYILSQKF